MSDRATSSSNAPPRAAEWVYSGIWRVLVDWFRVPADPPTLPVAPGDRFEQFKPARGFLQYLKLWFWIVMGFLLAGAIATGIALLFTVPLAGCFAVPLMLLLVAAIAAVGLLALHLRYDTTWYVMTDRSMRLRRGVWLIHEMTITYENIQNVSVSQGPVQRAFGISNLVVETAGGGGSGKGNQMLIANRGVIEGVQDPERLRTMILAKLRAARTAGLGDEDDQQRPSGAGGWTAEHVRVLREIRDELVRAAR